MRSRIKKLVIAEGVSKIGRYAFYKCAALESVELPDSLVQIEEGAFGRCTALEYVRLPASVTKIAEGLFARCKALREVKFGSGLEEIGEEAFRGCRNLRDVVLPEGLEEIGDEAFRGCVSLIAAEIPESVEEIGAYAFMDCPKLTIYTVADSEAAMYAQRSGIPVKPVSGAAQLKDKNVVLSGLRGHQREQVMEVLEAAGGIFREEVCGNTHYLIYDPADGMETKKFAEALENQKEATGLLLMDYRELIE
jgi:NAD-dependent DNA ligase